MHSKHQGGQLQPCCQIKSCVCVFKAISELMIHSIDQLGFSQPLRVPFIYWCCEVIWHGGIQISCLSSCAVQHKMFKKSQQNGCVCANQIFFFNNNEKWRSLPQTFTFIRNEAFYQEIQRGLEKMKILVMNSHLLHFLTSPFSSVTAGILGTEQKDHTNYESKVFFFSL